MKPARSGCEERAERDAGDRPRSIRPPEVGENLGVARFKPGAVACLERGGDGGG
jgi:hypothetical protein